MRPTRIIYRLVLAACMSTLASIASAASVPEGLCEILPNKGGFHLDIARRFAPPESRGVRVNAMGIDCKTLEAGENGRPSDPRLLFADYRVISDHGSPSEFDAAIDFFEELHGDHDDYMGRDDVAIYMSQKNRSLSGASAYSLINGTPHIFTLIDFDDVNAVERSRDIIAAFVRKTVQ